MSEIREFIESLSEDEVKKLSEWADMKRREQLFEDAVEKIAEMTDNLTYEIYESMQKDASLKSKVINAYRSVAPHAGTAALGVGTLAGIGALRADKRAQAAQGTADALAYGLAAETSADMRNERRMANELMRNRKAIVTLARAMQASRQLPQEVKAASEPSDLLGKIVRGLRG